MCPCRQYCRVCFKDVKVGSMSVEIESVPDYPCTLYQLLYNSKNVLRTDYLARLTLPAELPRLIVSKINRNFIFILFHTGTGYEENTHGK